MHPGALDGRVLPISDEPIRFSSAEEFRDRPRFVVKLDPRDNELAEIVGAYGFAKADELKCGFCGKWHQHGFLIKATSGDETNIGQDCGRLYFGADWDELYSIFQERDEAREQREFLEGTLREKASLIGKAHVLRAALLTRVDAVSAVVAELCREERLFRAAVAIERAGGKVQVERRIERDTYAGSAVSESQRTYIETAARIEAIEVLGLQYARRPCLEHIEALRRAVLTLEGLDPCSLRGLSAAQRKATVKQLEAVKNDLAAAQRHANDIERFLDPANIRNFAKMDAGRLNNRARSILRRFEAGYVKQRQ